MSPWACVPPSKIVRNFEIETKYSSIFEKPKYIYSYAGGVLYSLKFFK